MEGSRLVALICVLEECSDWEREFLTVALGIIFDPTRSLNSSQIKKLQEIEERVARKEVREDSSLG